MCMQFCPLNCGLAKVNKTLYQVPQFRYKQSDQLKLKRCCFHDHSRVDLGYERLSKIDCPSVWHSRQWQILFGPGFEEIAHTLTLLTNSQPLNSTKDNRDLELNIINVVIIRSVKPYAFECVYYSFFTVRPLSTVG